MKKLYIYLFFSFSVIQSPTSTSVEESCPFDEEEENRDEVTRQKVNQILCFLKFSSPFFHFFRALDT